MSFVGNVLSHAGGVITSTIGTVASGAQVVLGNTSIPLIFQNNTVSPIWIAVHAQFSGGSSAFPTQGWATHAWYNIAQGGSISVGNVYANVFYFNANDNNNHVWEGNYFFGSFVDGGGVTWNNKGFRLQQMPTDWLTFSSYTMNLN